MLCRSHDPTFVHLVHNFLRLIKGPFSICFFCICLVSSSFPILNLISNPILNPILNPISNPIFESDFQIQFLNPISNPVFESSFQIRFRFWQSYFIKLFGGGLQCKFIQNFLGLICTFLNTIVQNILIETKAHKKSYAVVDHFVGVAL